MKLRNAFIFVLCLNSLVGVAQEASPQVEQLKKQLQQLQEQFTRQQEEQRKLIENLRQQLEALEKKQSTSTAEQEKIRRLVDTQPPPAAKTPDETAAAAKAWKPSDPIRVGRGANFLDISAIGGLVIGGTTAPDIGALQPGGHDPVQRGFSHQGLELALSGVVDPYFRANANIVYQLDANGGSNLELEEAFAETTSLPANLQLRSGQYLTEFGRQNQTHPHTWGFVDSPLVNARLLGPDGLRNLGARISWLVPLPFYSELLLGVQNSQGETAFSFRNDHEGGVYAGRIHNFARTAANFGDMLITPRYSMSFDLSDTMTLLAGTSAAFGPNGSGTDTDSQIYGADLFWKWKPVNHHGGFPFVSFQTEAMLRKYQAGAFNWDQAGNAGDSDANGFVDSGILVDPVTGLPAVLPREKLTDYGFYSQLLYGFKKGWIAGLRWDYVSGQRGLYERMGLEMGDNANLGGAGLLQRIGVESERDTRWRISPNLTWFPTEFSKIRLQYNYDNRPRIGTDHSIWLQFEFVLGAHGAHKF
jgi:hypothetical protein